MTPGSTEILPLPLTALTICDTGVLHLIVLSGTTVLEYSIFHDHEFEWDSCSGMIGVTNLSHRSLAFGPHYLVLL